MLRFFFFFSSRRRHTRYIGDWSSDVCSSDLGGGTADSLRTDRKAFPAAGTPTAEAGICRITAVPGFAATAGRRAADAGKGRLGTAGTGQDSRAAVTTRGIEIPGAKRRTADAAATAGPVEKR